MQWNSNNLRDPAKQKIYGFAYDPLNRLAQSAYASNNAGTDDGLQLDSVLTIKMIRKIWGDFHGLVRTELVLPCPKN